MQEDMFDKIDGIVGYFVTVMKDVYFFSDIFVETAACNSKS